MFWSPAWVGDGDYLGFHVVLVIIGRNADRGRAAGKNLAAAR